MHEILSNLSGTDPRATLLLILNIIVMESLLSIDNAAVLASMVMDLPENERKPALLWGMIGAVGFRIICLFLASIILRIWWIESIGGIYLLLLVFKYFHHKSKKSQEGRVYRFKLPSKWKKYITPFVATVFMIQFMDLAFSMDNILAVVAFTKNMTMIIIGVVIGIVTMRFVANWFVTLMVKYPFLEVSAYLIIAMLGIKLALSLFTHYNPDIPVIRYIGSGGNVDHETKELVDKLFSLLTLLIFIVPVITSMAFNFPRKHSSGAAS